MDLAVFYHGVQAYLVQHALLSPVIYVGLHILFAICLIPCSPMTVLAGVLWGKWIGLCVSIVAAFFSSCATFGMSRFFLRKKIYQFLQKRYPRTDWFLDQTKKHGWKFVALIQLNPAAPGAILGYLFGLTKIEFPVYATFLILFMLPLQFVLVVLGDSFSQAWVAGMSWMMTGALLLCVLGYYSYRKIVNYRGRSSLNEI